MGWRIPSTLSEGVDGMALVFAAAPAGSLIGSGAIAVGATVTALEDAYGERYCAGDSACSTGSCERLSDDEKSNAGV